VGKYEAVLVSDGKNVQRSAFWVVAKGAIPKINSNKSTYAAGESIIVTWENAYARKFDWIGIFSTSNPDIYYTQASFAYTKAAVNGQMVFTSEQTGGALPAGQYEVRYLSDDSYIVSAAKKFTVTP